MTLTLIENGEVYTPEPAGKTSVLLDDGSILRVGEVNPQTVRDIGVKEVHIYDASGCVIIPGIIDPHQHILGGGGEEGFASRMPEITFSDVITSGITTLVGLLGTDTTARSLPGLYSKASQLSDEGLTTFMYTGGFEIPAQTITGSLRDDIIMVDKVIGTGEIAIADPRWLEPKLHELAFVVYETKLGGRLGGKAGVTHFHLGEGKTGMSLIRELMEEHEVTPENLYATHINRMPKLMEEAAGLAKRGMFVDMDSTEEKLPEHLRAYLDLGGPPDQLTFSSDTFTPGGSPQRLFGQLAALVHNDRFCLEQVLPHFTVNTARVLKLKNKGRLQDGLNADVLVLRKDTLEIVHMFAMGRQLIKDGQMIVKSKAEQEVEESLKTSKR